MTAVDPDTRIPDPIDLDRLEKLKDKGLAPAEAPPAKRPPPKKAPAPPAAPDRA